MTEGKLEHRNKPRRWGKTMKKLLAAWALIVMIAGCSATPKPSPSPTLRAPECFDGTVENGCPSWALNVPPDKKVSHFSTEGEAVYMHYTDGTKTRVR